MKLHQLAVHGGVYVVCWEGRQAGGVVILLVQMAFNITC
jgi:hypothetical protein